MKRLMNYLKSMQQNETNYTAMYEGVMNVITPYGTMLAFEPKYYNGRVGFEFECPNKLERDKPTVIVTIPADILINNNGGNLLKRLKYYFLQMEEKTTTYSYHDKNDGNKVKNLYDAEVVETTITPDGPMEFTETYSEPTFWDKSVSYTLEKSNKLRQDCPTINVAIPTDILGVSESFCNSENNAGLTRAAADYCLRRIEPYFESINESLYNHSRPDKENGRFYIYSPRGEILTRNTAYFKICPQKDYVNGNGNSVYVYTENEPKQPKMCLCIRFQVQLPAKKLKKTIKMLCGQMPEAVNHFIDDFDTASFERVLELANKQASIREYLKHSNYCAFIANGSILPRSKGTDEPMAGAVPFISTPDDEIEICGVRGMGIKRGVTVITGGGYSGKSTLLDAIASGIYDHIGGDGRELCITDESAVIISAEDGRSVKNVNIAPFIKWIPGGDTRDFSTEHASGSTSQAANIMEAVDYGTKLLLIDEDKSATNFMIRDKLMKELIKKEPITPFTDRVGELYSQNGVSTVLVIGGSGEYLSVADKIYMMDDFIINDVTNNSQKICASHKVIAETPSVADWSFKRYLLSDGFTSYPEGSRTELLEVSDMGFIFFGDEHIDIRMLHNIITTAQLNTIGFILRQISLENKALKIDMNTMLDDIYSQIEKDGVDVVFSNFFTSCDRFLDLPRKSEVLSVISRMRRIKFARI